MAVQDVNQPQEMDLTGYHLHDLSEVSIPDDIRVRSRISGPLNGPGPLWTHMTWDPCAGT